MIICSSCGSPLSAGLSFCSECGAATATDLAGDDPARTLRLDMSANPLGGGQGARLDSPIDYANPAWHAPAAGDGGGFAGSPARPQSSAPKILLIVLGLTTIAALAVTAYFISRSGSSSAGPAPENLAASLQSAVDNGRLVTLSGDDAYTYFYRLRDQEPQHKALSQIKPRVLPGLRRLGDEVFDRRVSMGLEVLTERDWTIAQRAYEWAHLLEPGDKTIEARWKYAEGNLAKIQGRRDDAQSGFAAAAQLDSSWALPFNDLGYMYTLSKRYSEAIPYYQRAINLQPGWDIPYNNMGTAYYYQKSYDQAETWYRKTVEVNTSWATPHAWLGSIYENKKMSGAAIEEYQTAINLYNPNRDRINIAEVQNKITSLQNR